MSRGMLGRVKQQANHVRRHAQTAHPTLVHQRVWWRVPQLIERRGDSLLHFDRQRRRIRQRRGCRGFGTTLRLLGFGQRPGSGVRAEPVDRARDVPQVVADRRRARPFQPDLLDREPLERASGVLFGVHKRVSGWHQKRRNAADRSPEPGFNVRGHDVSTVANPHTRVPRPS
jgi:hypothetical protein